MIAAMLAAALAATPAELPRDVRQFVERRMECDHWTGEEPYDKARRREIEAAIRDLRCAAIDRDDQRLTHRYSDRPQVLEALRLAREGV